MQALHGQQDPGLGLEPQLEPKPQAWMENQDLGSSCCLRTDEWTVFGELKANSCVKGSVGIVGVVQSKSWSHLTQTAFPGFSWDATGSENPES